MSAPTFLSLVRGNRVEGFLGLKMKPGYAYRYATNYSYIELPLSQVRIDDEKQDTDKVTRNQFAILQAPATVSPQYQHQVMLVFNPAIFRFASGPSTLIVNSGETVPIEMPVRTFKDLHLADLDWLVRLYLFS